MTDDSGLVDYDLRGVYTITLNRPSVRNTFGDPSQMAYTRELIATMHVSNEGQEGLATFFEKRKPGWQG